MPLFDKILIAARGEIAVRIIRSCRRSGIPTVAFYTAADRDSLFVRLADQAVAGQGEGAAAWLDRQQILAAAAVSGATAIHPGYGFLAENAAFADDCAGAGLTLIGPPAAAIRAMAGKDSSRRLAASLDIPTLPGSDEASDDPQELQQRAEDYGLPVMLKAVSGGGGIGMRLVRTSGELPAAIASATAEAGRAFGDSRLLVEKAVEQARHIEVQILRDQHGHGIHLFDRECSLQRRRQKLIEEGPAPGLDAGLRRSLQDAALRLAAAVDYTGAGTVEFLLDRQGQFWFLEMNTRLQVEHTVTESITGLDLVAWQLRIAAGQTLDLRQEDIPCRGHAVQARVCAEDCARDFSPVTGPVICWRPDQDLRCDSGIDARTDVTAHFDSLQAKLIARGETRAEALAALRSGLARSPLLGITSNRHFLRQLLALPLMQEEGGVHTGTVEETPELFREDLPDARRCYLGAVAAAVLAAEDGRHPWPGATRITETSRWLLDGRPLVLELQDRSDGGRRVGQAGTEPAQGHRLEIEGTETLSLPGQRRRQGWRLYRLTTVWNGLREVVLVATCGPRVHIDHPETGARWLEESHAGETGNGGFTDRYTATMPATVVSVAVRSGDRVGEGDILLTFESMKMQSSLKAGAAGIIDGVDVQAGDRVRTGDLLLRMSPVREEPS